MGRRKNKSAMIPLIVLVAALAGGLAYMAYNAYVAPASTLTPFSLSIADPLDGDTLPLSSFDYDLYGLPIGESPSDVVAWETIESGTTLEGITAADLDTATYSQFYVRFNGTVLQTAAAFDDAFGSRTYPSRQQALVAGQANVLNAYAAPINVTMHLFDSITLVENTNLTAANITAQTNITIVVMSSSTYPNHAYQAYWSFSANDMVYPQIVLTYNTTVTTATAIQISGTSMTRVSTTSMAYRFSTLGAIQSFSARWPAAAADLNITSAAVAFDGTDLATNP